MKTKHLLLAALALMLIVPAASAAHSVTISNRGDASTGTYTIQVDVDKFNLVDFAGKDAMKGEGHIHYLVNGKDACSAGKAACNVATDYATTNKRFTFTNLEDGDVIEVELVLSDHTASGTDSSGTLNGARVTDSLTVGGSNGAPGVGLLAALAAVGAVVVLRRR